MTKELNIEQERREFDIDSLAQEIRRIDGDHSLGAGALAEALMPFIKRAAMGGAKPVAYVKYVDGVMVIDDNCISEGPGDVYDDEREEWRPVFTAPPPADAPTLPDDFSESKDWRESNYAGRVDWLMSTVKSQREEIEQLVDQASAGAKDSERIPARAELLHKLYHHQGGSSPVGQAIRALLGIGQYDKLTKEQLAEIKTYAAIAATEAKQ